MLNAIIFTLNLFTINFAPIFAESKLIFFDQMKTWVGNSLASISEVSIVECSVHCVHLDCLGFYYNNELCQIYPKVDPCDDIPEKDVIDLFIIDIEKKKVSFR